MSFIDPALFSEFANCVVSIYADGVAVPTGRGARVPGEPVALLTGLAGQEWDLSADDKAGLTGEEIRLMRKVRLDGFYPAITEKHIATLDGVRHNIVLVSHDGSKSCTILTLRRVTS